jgi:hypothetical protein
MAVRSWPALKLETVRILLEVPMYLEEVWRQIFIPISPTPYYLRIEERR